jgi:hypothetical protein
MKIIKSALILSAITMSLSAQAVQFRIEWQNHGPQGLSPLFFSVGSATFDIFQLGGTASLGIKDIAERGNATAMTNLAIAAGSQVQTHGVLGSSGLAPGGMRTALINVDAGNDYFSFATMLGRTNDAFIGESVSSQGLRLFNGSSPLGFSVNIYGARVWDAGTEENTQSAADLGFLGGSGNPADSNSMIRTHATITQGLGAFNQMPDWDNNTRLTTISVIPVPEPATMTAMLLGLGAIARRTRKSK